MTKDSLKNTQVAVVIPYYNASTQILRVISKLPEYITTVIIVNDQSPEALPETEISALIKENTKCYFISNKVNLGVGGATKKGFEFAIEHDIDIVIKVDSDDQMDLGFIPDLINPIIHNNKRVVKGNRFKNRKALKKMPLLRRIGNLGLSFLVKIATGYWHNFDPTNGFIAIKTSVLKEINFSNLSNRYYLKHPCYRNCIFKKCK